MNKKLLFVTGFQKSGTSLLNRLLMLQKDICNPFLPEGKLFWGDEPVDDPQMSPCGELYQKANKTNGYQLSDKDFMPEHQKLLTEKILKANIQTPVLMNKNPNLIVRLPWLKKIFPQCKIIVVVRKPIPNLYSFSKKLHNKKKECTGYWWGVKPLNWQAMINQDPLIQITNQWVAVFKFLIENIDLVDMFIEYQSLCENPSSYITDIYKLINLYNPNPIVPTSKLSCMDEEYLSGGNLESKNVLLRRNNSFDTSEDHDSIKTFNAFSSQEISFIKSKTDKIWSHFYRTIHS